MPCKSKFIFTTKTGKYFHKISKCGNHRLRSRIKLETALYQGKIPCNSCYSKEKLKNLEKKYVYKKNYLNSIKNYRLTDEYKFSVLKSRAKKYNKEISLSFNEISFFYVKSCIYCGSNEKNDPYKRKNGLDRLNNDKGYTKDNCISCCRNCNYMKWIYNVKDFLMACRNISNNKKAVYDEFESKKDFHGTKYRNYVFDAKKKIKIYHR